MIVLALPSESRSRIPMMGVGLALAAALALATVAAGDRVDLGSIALGRTAAPERVKAAAAVPGVDERAVILDVIRDHRRTTDESWRQRLADAIYHEAVAAEVDPLMVASIVAKESSFRTRVVSHAGAVGLMQLRPWVAEDVAERRAVEWKGMDTLHSPRLNVRLGILYYQELVDTFEGDEHLALAAYNNGPTRIRRQLRNGNFNGSAYAERVMGFYEELKTRRDRAS